MPYLTDHPLRYTLANELHARPFPKLQAPAQAAFLALTPAMTDGVRDHAADRAQLIDLLDRHGAAHPRPDATHYAGNIGKHRLKWENHSEFVTYTIFSKGVAKLPFGADGFDAFPTDWLENAKGVRLTSALFQINVCDDEATLNAQVDDWFVDESVAVSRVLEGELTIAGDFRIDPAGHMRFAVFARQQTGAHRIGRVVQRLCEIETYKATAMLGFAMTRDLNPQMGALEVRLGQLVGDLNSKHIAAAKTLDQLLSVAAQLEDLAATATYRFGATQAYESIVNQRILILREARFMGRQTFTEFMMRRFDPAMRTVSSMAARLDSLTQRAARAGDLLRTRVDVERSAQNQDLLASMDRRADMQLRLQQTVEGLSVVAISYYGVNLALYMLGPFQQMLGLSKSTLAAIVTPIVLAVVWAMIRRIHRRMTH